MAAKGLDVVAQRRHLEMCLAEDGGDGAVVDAGRNRLDAGCLEAGDHGLGRRLRRDVDVADGAAQDGVANAAADEARGLTLGAQRRHHGHGLVRRHPRLGIDLAGLVHRLPRLLDARGLTSPDVRRD